LHLCTRAAQRFSMNLRSISLRVGKLILFFQLQQQMHATTGVRGSEGLQPDAATRHSVTFALWEE